MKKVVINLSGKFLHVLAAVLAVLVFTTNVYAYGTSSPSSFGHSVGEMNWDEAISRITAGQICFDGGSCRTTWPVDTDTNANTICSGTYTYLNGEGVCRDVRDDGDAYDTDTRCDSSGQCVQVCIGSTCKTTWPVDTDTDTNANTICSGTYTYLNGDGSCRDVRADGDLYDSVNDADANPSNELQNLASVLARGANGGGYGMSGLGDVYATAFYYSSDKRLKKNIAQIADAVSLVEGLEGVSFEWNDDGDKAIGLIAQDVEKVIPEVVGIDENGFKSVQYANLVAVLIEAIKEQQKEIENQNSEIEYLKSEVESLKGN